MIMTWDEQELRATWQVFAKNSVIWCLRGGNCYEKVFQVQEKQYLDPVSIKPLAKDLWAHSSDSLSQYIVHIQKHMRQEMK